MSTLAAGSSAVSIAVPEWDITLRAHALLSESVMEDRVKATFDFRLHPSDLNGLFEWNTESNGYLLKFKTGASTSLTSLVSRQVYAPQGETLSGISVSLATHFICAQSSLSLSDGMTGAGVTTQKMNMIEEKILAVSEDIFNSTSAFTLFQPQSRLLLANDYYNSGREAYKYITTTKFTTAVASGIYQNLISYREPTTMNTTFSEFMNGDELTFNVIAVSSDSQYEITPLANRNLMDRAYKFRIVADSGITASTSTATGASAYNAAVNSSYAGISTPSFLGQFIMGHTNTTTHSSVYNVYTKIENSAVGSTSFIDSKNAANKLYSQSSPKADGSVEF